MSLVSAVAVEPPAAVDEILTLEELAARLKLSRWTVRRLIKRKILSPLRTGRVLRFHWPTVKHRLGATLPEPIPDPRAHSFGGPRIPHRLLHR